MDDLIITIPGHLHEFLRRQAAEGGHDSPEAYLVALVESACAKAEKERLKALMIEGLESGPARPMTRRAWDEMRRRYAERHGMPDA